MKTRVVWQKSCAVLLALLMLFGLASCQKKAPVTFTFNEVSTVQHTDKQAQYLNGSYNSVASYADGTKELSKTLPITLKWEAVAAKDENAEFTDYTVKLSENSDLSDAVEYKVKKSASLKLYNLKIATTYYYTVSTVYNGETVTSPVQQFTTEDAAPRNMTVDGVTNVRDLGGWKTENGGRVRQGLIYRCGRLNKSYKTSLEYDITAEGIDTMQNEMKIKTEIDLRRNYAGEDHSGQIETSGITESVLEGVLYVACPMTFSDSDPYGYNILTNNLDEVKHVFEVLSDKNNYPVIFNCNIGTDRTGMIAFLVNGLLGVAEEDLYRDYLFSNFGNIGSARDLARIENYVTVLKNAPGATLSEKIYNYLADTVGVPRAQLDAVIEILYQA